MSPMRPRPTPRRLAPALVLALAIGAACSSSGDDRADAENVVDQERTESGESGGRPAHAAPTEPLATVAGEEGVFEQLEIVDLRRTGDTVTVEFVVVTGDAVYQEGYALGAAEDRHSVTGHPDNLYAVSGVTLVDQHNRRKHLVLRDTEGVCLCTRFRDVVLTPGTRYPHSAQFAAPPDDVESMTVQVPVFPAVDDVPLRTVG